MKTFFYSISFLALLANPVSCSIENTYSNQDQTSVTETDANATLATGIDSTIDPPLMPTKP